MRTLFLAGLLSSLVLACGSADGPPLGGPYGGVASKTVGPTAGPAAENSPGSGNGSGGGNASPNANTNSGDSTGNSGTGSGTSAGSTGSGSGSGESAVDAGSNPPVETDAGASASAAPTWSSIYKAYMAAGTEGNCGGCHGEMGTASGSYSYLTNKRQLGGAAAPALVSSSTSCLSWMGGNMPPLGPSSDATATAELQAWAGAGAQNN